MCVYICASESFLPNIDTLFYILYKSNFKIFSPKNIIIVIALYIYNRYALINIFSMSIVTVNNY